MTKQKHAKRGSAFSETQKRSHAGNAVHQFRLHFTPDLTQRRPQGPDSKSKASRESCSSCNYAIFARIPIADTGTYTAAFAELVVLLL